MTRLTPRLRWRQAVASEAFPASQRPVKATLLSLVELMTSTGELRVRRDQLEAAMGLPPRTLNRHLARAVEDGWLPHEVQGGYNHRAVYQATIPDGSVGHSRRTEAKFCRPSTRMQNPESCRPPCGPVNRDSASDSERVAVDSHRGRRRTHDGSRVPLLALVQQDGSDNGMDATPVPFSTADPSVPTTRREAGWSA